MLNKLYIKDFALIENLQVEFNSGLTILTGETGAGKSIIVGALSLLLGERAYSDTVRQGADKAVIEGFFSIKDTGKWNLIKDHISDFNQILILRREIYATGRSRCFINDSPVSGVFLSEVGDLLVDLHGQHAHQNLLKSEQHLTYLDEFGVNPDLRTKVKEGYKQIQKLAGEIDTLKQKETELRQKRELLEFQVKEITAINPQPEEEADLVQEEKLLSNCEKLFQISAQLSEILYEGEGSVSEKIAFAEESIAGLSHVDSRFEKWSKDCKDARIQIEEVITNLQAFVSNIEFNPERLEEVRDRLGNLSLIKKKYGGDLSEVIRFWKTSEESLSLISSMGSEIETLENQLDNIKTELSQHCKSLSEERIRLAKELEKKTVSVFNELGLQNGQFEIKIHQRENSEGLVRINGRNYSLNADGIDQIEFYISLNPGEPPKPLVKIASGGEISRIMLALKTALAEADAIPVLIFDEIDTGISGRIAQMVGKNLKEVSTRHQVLCITHLPLIASAGDHHFSVVKEINNNRSLTTIKLLDKEERIHEIAKLIGGENVTESTLKNARELLQV